MMHTQRNVIGIGLIGIGILFLIMKIGGFGLLMSMGWPLFILIPGLAWLYMAYTQPNQHANMITPAMVTTGTGLILLYQNTTGHWESWAYIWSLYPVFIGAGMVWSGSVENDHEQQEQGYSMVKWGTIAFVALWALFEVVIFGSNRLASTLMPLGLIGVGVYLLLQGRKPSVPGAHYTKQKPKNTSDLQRQIDEALRED